MLRDYLLGFYMIGGAKILVFFCLIQSITKLSHCLMLNHIGSLPTKSSSFCSPKGKMKTNSKSSYILLAKFEDYTPL